MKTIDLKILFLTMLSAAVFFGCGRSTQHAAATNNADAQHISAAAQVISLQEGHAADTVNFGKVGSGEIVTRPLTLRNGGSEPVVIIDVDKTCGCVDITYPRHPLKAGEGAAVELEFDSRGIKGWVYKTMILKTSSSPGEHLIVVTADVE